MFSQLQELTEAVFPSVRLKMRGVFVDHCLDVSFLTYSPRAAGSINARFLRRLCETSPSSQILVLLFLFLFHEESWHSCAVCVAAAPQVLPSRKAGNEAAGSLAEPA